MRLILSLINAMLVFLLMTALVQQQGASGKVAYAGKVVVLGLGPLAMGLCALMSKHVEFVRGMCEQVVVATRKSDWQNSHYARRHYQVRVVVCELSSAKVAGLLGSELRSGDFVINATNEMSAD